MIILGMQNIDDQPKYLSSFNAVKSVTDEERKHYLLKISGQIVDKFVLEKHSLNTFLPKKKMILLIIKILLLMEDFLADSQAVINHLNTMVKEGETMS